MHEMIDYKHIFGYTQNYEKSFDKSDERYHLTLN